jgi:hypothetical protein
MRSSRFVVSVCRVGVGSRMEERTQIDFLAQIDVVGACFEPTFVSSVPAPNSTQIHVCRNTTRQALDDAPHSRLEISYNKLKFIYMVMTVAGVSGAE